jgi:hypothetical protein
MTSCASGAGDSSRDPVVQALDELSAQIKQSSRLHRVEPGS